MTPRLARTLFVFAAGLAMLCAAAQPASAEDGACPICQKAGAEDATYTQKAGNTLARGASNAVFGWTELIRQPAQEAKGGGNVFVGIGKGVSQGVMRTLAGAGELLTFWTPKVQNSYIHFATDCPICMGRQQAQASSAQSTVN